MMSKKGLYIILGVVVVIIILIAVMASQEKSRSKILIGAGIIPPPGTSKERNDEFPLKVGSYGPNVKGLQNSLNKVYNAGLKVDSSFGDLTKTAVETHLSNLTGHKFGQVTYAEYQYLIKL